MKSIILYSLVVGLIIACNSSKTKKTQVNASSIENMEESMYVFDLESALRQPCVDSNSLNSIAQEINFIHFDNSRNSLLTNLNLILEKVDNKFIASSMKSCVMEFDSNGIFQKKLIDIGRAKNEVQNKLYQWAYQNDQLTLCQGNKMITYSPFTKKTKGYISKQYYYNVILLKDGNYVALPNLGPEMADSRYLDFLDANYEILQSVSYNQKRAIHYLLPKFYTGHLETYGLYPSYTGEALFKDVFNDTIYTVKGVNRIVPYIYLKRGDFMPTVRNVTNESGNKELIFIKNIAESERYVFVNYGFQESMFSAIFYKESGEIVNLAEMKLEKATSIINSKFFIDYITPKGKKIKVGIIGIKRDRIYCVVRTQDALDFMPGMDEYDNPLILEVILK